MKKSLTSIYQQDRNHRLAVLSAHYNIRYDGLLDNGAGKGLLAILAHTVPAGKKTRAAGRQGETAAGA